MISRGPRAAQLPLRPPLNHPRLQRACRVFHLASPLNNTRAADGRRQRMVIKIAPNDKGNPVGKLADAELHFTEGELQGMKLMGFAVWERKNGPGRNVTFPARAYSVNG